MKPFLTGKKQLDITPLRFPTTPSPLASAAAAAAASAVAARCPAPAGAEPSAPDNPPASSPRVEVVREGDKVVRLIVTCSCGERIEVDCQYPSGA